MKKLLAILITVITSMSFVRGVFVTAGVGMAEIANAQLSPKSILMVNPDGVHFSLSNVYLAPIDTNTCIMSFHRADSSISVILASIALKLNKTDTSSMLANYLRSNIAASLYQPIGSYATTTQLVTKVNISDTAGMLANYLRSNIAAATYATIGNDLLKVKYTDTASMLTNYLRSNIAAATYATITNLALKNNISDTAAMLSTYLRSNIAAATYVTPISTNTFTNKSGNISQWTNDASYLTSASISGKLNISDTASMLSKYLRTNIAAATYQPIGSYLTANQTITLSGDVTGSGATGITTTLATVNSNVGTFNSSYTVNAKGLVTAATNASFNTTPARTLSTTGSNNTFTISATKNARVHYTVNFAFALTLTTSNGYVQLDYSTDGGSNWVTCGSVSSVYSLSVTLTGNNDQELVGEIPANALVRLYRINATNVTVTMPTTKQLEVTY